MSTNFKQEEMCEKFQSLFKHYIPGVDFIILDENEQDADHETREPVSRYNLDFKDLKEKASHDRTNHGCLTGINGSVFSAFDAATETFIVSARPDIYKSVFGGKSDTGLFVPFSQHDTVPADPQKAAAYLYQESYTMALYYKHYEKNGEQMVDFAEKAETYKLQAMGEKAKAEEKKSLLEYLKSKSYSDRFVNAEKFMSSEYMRQSSSDGTIKYEGSQKAFAAVAKREMGNLK